MDVKNKESAKYWYAVYTRSRAEKKVRDELMNKNIECYLPLQKKLRQWKDRKKWVEMPIISGYCFVHISRKEYEIVLQSNNVVRFICFEGKASVIPGNQIHFLKKMMDQNDFEVDVTPDNFSPGENVEIIEGPLIGVKGELVESRGKNKFILRFHQINSTFTLEVPASQLSFLPPQETLS